MPDIILFKGIFLGFAIAAIVGPIGILCLRRSIDQGFWMGLAVGIGASFADAFYAAIAAFGLNFISKTLIYATPFLRIIGGAYLIYLGFNAFFTNPRTTQSAQAGNFLSSIISFFLLTLTNPVTILSFLALFTGANIQNLVITKATLLVVGVFIGSLMWWIILSGIGATIAKRVTHQTIIWINRISGILIIFFGLSIIFMLLYT